MSSLDDNRIEAAPATPAAGLWLALQRQHQPVVLVVDDDTDIRDTVAHMLTVRGFQVLVASDTPTALAVCRGQQGGIAAVVADLSIPGEVPGGLERAVSAECPGIKVVYVTGIPRHVALTSGLVRPDAPYLEKPVDADKLTGVLRSLSPSKALPTAPS